MGRIEKEKRLLTMNWPIAVLFLTSFSLIGGLANNTNYNLYTSLGYGAGNETSGNYEVQALQPFTGANISTGNGYNYYATHARTFNVDTTYPTNLQRISPTLGNNTNTTNQYLFFNVTFTEIFPSICMLTLWNNVTDGERNYTMMLSQNVTNSSGIGSYCTVNLSLTDGTYRSNFTINDTNGNSNTSTTFHNSIDSAVPIITLVSPATQSIVTGLPIPFVFTVISRTSASCSVFIQERNQTDSYYTAVPNNTNVQINVSNYSGTRFFQTNYLWDVRCNNIAGAAISSASGFTWEEFARKPPSVGSGSPIPTGSKPILVNAVLDVSGFGKILEFRKADEYFKDRKNLPSLLIVLVLLALIATFNHSGGVTSGRFNLLGFASGLLFIVVFLKYVVFGGFIA